MSAAPKLDEVDARWPHVPIGTVEHTLRNGETQGAVDLLDRMEAMNTQKPWARCYFCGVSVKRENMKRGRCPEHWLQGLPPKGEPVHVPGSETPHPGYIIDDRHVSVEQAVRMWDNDPRMYAHEDE